MKKSLKTYLLLFLLFFISFIANVQSQTIKQKAKNCIIEKRAGELLINNNSAKLPSEVTPGNTNDISKSFTVLLSQDFSSITFPPIGWTTTWISGTLNWTRDVGAQTYGWLSNVGTSSDNGYAFVDSDGNGGAGGHEDCSLTTPAINCTGHNYVWLRFNEYFYQYMSSSGHVEVSNNGSTWTTFHQAEFGLGTNQSTANPYKINVDISSIAANQPMVYVRFHWIGDYDYYWFIDDVEVYSRPQYDAAFSARTNMNEYSCIPLMHYTSAAIPRSATAINAGGATITNVFMSNTVYDGFTWTPQITGISNTIASLSAGNTGSLSASSYTPPVSTGFYVEEYIVDMTQTDADIYNDTVQQGFWINDSLFARDDAIFTSSIDGSLGSVTQSLIMGNNYTLKTADRLTHIEAYVTDPLIGDQTQLVVYNTSSGLPTTLVAASSIYTFTTGGGQWVDLPMAGGPIALSTGTYFFGLKQISSIHNIGLAYTDNNYTQYKAYAKIGTDPWDTMSALGYNIVFLVRPYLVCGSYKPTITPTVGHVCIGDQETLTSSPGSSYLWSPGGQTTQAINITSAGTYSVQTISTIGCTGTSNPIVINQYVKPSVSLGSDTTACSGYVLDAGGGYVSYSWTGGSSSNQYLSIGSSGTYSVTVTDSYCPGSDTVIMTIIPAPSVFLGNDTSLCLDQNINLDAGAGYVSYVWSPGGSSNQNLIVDTSLVGVGTTPVFAVVDDGTCLGGDTINITFTVCANVNKDSENEVLLVYPNPSGGDVFVNFGTLKGHCKLLVMNILGEVVISKDVYINDYYENVLINKGEINKGIYLFSITGNDQIFSARVVIE